MSLHIHEIKNRYGKYLIALSINKQRLKITKILNGDIQTAAKRLIPNVDQKTRDQIIGKRKQHTINRL